MVRRIGKYEVQAELGKGGFGCVYRAWDPTVGRLVAVKVLRILDSPELRVRFRNEAAAAGALRHENLVTVYDYGEHEGTPYLVMEFVNGRDLYDLIYSPSRSFTILEKLRILYQTASGLACAHQNGVVHRDVKPANIMVREDGIVKITDFGIARLTRESLTLTGANQVIGTLIYLAPEQFQGAQGDQLCDIFAYGVLAYEFLTGRHPFQSGDAVELIRRLATEDPEPVRAIAPECPAALERIVLHALNRDRYLRCQSFEDILFDMQPVLEELARKEAVVLLDDAFQVFQQQDFDRAQLMIREVLRLDPANTEGRRLRDSIQKVLHERNVRPRIEELVRRAQEALLARRISAAVDFLESALRLDSENLTLRRKLADAQRTLEQVRHADQCLQEAVREFDNNNLTVAFQHASEALQSDPNHSGALALIDRVRNELQERESKRRLEEGLAKARGLMLTQNFDQAVELLTRLESELGSNETIQSALGRARQARQERELRQWLNARKEEGRNLIASGEFQDAVSSLQTLAHDFPQDLELSELISYAQEQMLAATRRDAIQQAVRQAEGLRKEENFNGALRVLDKALLTWTNDTALLEHRREVLAASALRTRLNAIQKGVDEAAAARSSERFDDAAKILRSVMTVYPGEEVLRNELDAVQLAQAEHAKNVALNGACLRAGTLRASGNFEQALRVLDLTLVRYPGVERLRELRQAIQKEADLQRKEQVEARRRAEEQEAVKREEELRQRLLERAREKQREQERQRQEEEQRRVRDRLRQLERDAERRREKTEREARRAAAAEVVLKQSAQVPALPESMRETVRFPAAHGSSEVPALPKPPSRALVLVGVAAVTVVAGSTAGWIVTHRGETQPVVGNQTQMSPPVGSAAAMPVPEASRYRFDHPNGTMHGPLELRKQAPPVAPEIPTKSGKEGQRQAAAGNAQSMGVKAPETNRGIKVEESTQIASVMLPERQVVVLGESPEPAAPAQPEPQIVEKPYYGPPRLEFRWAGSLNPGEVLTIQGPAVSAGQLLSPSPVPLTRGAVTTMPGIDVVQQPDVSNQFRMVLRNATVSPIRELTFVWKHRRQQ